MKIIKEDFIYSFLLTEILRKKFIFSDSINLTLFVQSLYCATIINFLILIPFYESQNIRFMNLAKIVKCKLLLHYLL